CRPLPLPCAKITMPPVPGGTTRCPGRRSRPASISTSRPRSPVAGLISRELSTRPMRPPSRRASGGIDGFETVRSVRCRPAGAPAVVRWPYTGEEASMPSHYAQAVHRASVWVADVAAALGTSDRNYARRVLRAWLHTLRDRLTIDAAAKFGQQLPELLRGTYYDGWEPNRVPMRYNAAEYVQRFAAEAIVAPSEVPGIAAAVTDVISDHMSPGQVIEARAELPAGLRATVQYGAPVTQRVEPRQPAATKPSIDDRLSALTEAVQTLVRGLQGN